jgi:hypothetical protein
MAVSLNHTIVAWKDAKAGAAWLAEILGLPAPKTLLTLRVRRDRQRRHP